MPVIWRDDPLASLPEIPLHPCRPGSPEGFASKVRADDIEAASNVLSRYQPQFDGDNTRWVLQAFLDNLSGPGLSRLISEILGFALAPNQLRRLRNFLVDAVLKPMAIAAGKQPQATARPKWRSDLEKETIEVTGLGALRRECLRRDNNRCVVTKVMDSQKFGEDASGCHDSVYEPTDCAQIFPFALSSALEEKCATHTSNKAAICWALREYFPVLKTSGLDRHTIVTPENSITLCLSLTREFGDFLFGFEPTSEVNRYRIIVLDKGSALGHTLPDMIKLSKHAAISMPDPNLLEVHLRIARILTATGVRRAVHENVWLYKELTVNKSSIAGDGSTDLSGLLHVKMFMGI